jgi:hypothetical protein
MSGFQGLSESELAAMKRRSKKITDWSEFEIRPSSLGNGQMALVRKSPAKGPRAVAATEQDYVALSAFLGAGHDLGWW